ncbi:sodium:solute symporter family protein [Hyalomma marginatum]|uniref:Sodium:solute symporter family protein n=1 Tax=Hyalomma marginatum TaxID=34627 RepID=A0A8S4C2Y9_9ACAR|nr:sodium:solute symporter family protein [Hyalomma marginatum]CAG7598348.1 sodium:solute symporter family protein [Hyalomma marginatum]
MSTADSWLNNTSVLVTHDIVKKLIPLTEKQAITIARLSTFGVAGLAVLLSFLEKGIMELEWLSGNFLAPLIIVPLTAGFLKFWTNSKSFIASVTLAILFTCISGYIAGEFATISLMCGMVGSAIGLFGMHHWQKLQGTDTVKKHRELAVIDAEKRNNIAYANSADQIEEWYNENRAKIKKIEFILEEIRK